MKKILFAASECVPFVQTGGLADVVGALPKALDEDEYDVRVVIPDYTCIPQQYRTQFSYVNSFSMDMGMQGEQHVGIMTCTIHGIQYYFINNDNFFGGATPYSDDMVWDIQKFAYFSKAVLSILPSIDFHPDVIHCHDWQTSLIPVYLKEMFMSNPYYHRIRTIMTIHNLEFQGKWDISTVRYASGLPRELFTPDKLEFNYGASMMKGGLVYADLITTVSESYAEEICTPAYGEGLDGLLTARKDSTVGIVNGIDGRIYNPASDKMIPQNYNLDNVEDGKYANKVALQKELGLKEDPETMMIAMITRLTDQKGLEMVKWVINRMLNSRMQLVIIGTGDENYENLFRHYDWTHKDQVSASILFDNALSHRVYAAADAILMPSKFEPCGLTQLIAMRYGTVPIVRETGGLRDTVVPYNSEEQTGTGFTFTNFNADEMLDTIFRAEKTFYDEPSSWRKIVRRAMEADFSWKVSAQKYEELYDSLI